MIRMNPVSAANQHLGSGEMGEVYLAHDARLDRHVGIKLLPEQFAANVLSRAPASRGGCRAALDYPFICKSKDLRSITASCCA